jgi:hypothetical protein
MFKRIQNKPITETPAAIIAPAQARDPDLEESRAESQSELDFIQDRLDETDHVIRDLQAQIGKNLRLGHPTSPADPAAIALNEARDHAKELRTARDKKAAEVDGITKQIRNKACGPIMRELESHVRKAAALFAQALEPNARAHACVQQLQELGAEIPEVFIRGLSIATTAPTDYSNFCDACAQAEIKIEKPAGDIPTIPPAASFYFRQHDNLSHDMRLASNVAGSGAGAGFSAGFRQGYMTRARAF